MINVTRPFLPSQEKYISYVKSIFERNWLTNNGPLVNELELKLKEYLQLNHLLYLSNGTIALQIAIKALDLKGEIITTPFSYVATTSSIVWEGCVPRFVDIHPGTLNIDPSKIEEAITANTSAILATHVYGNPCDVEAIDSIAKKYNLKVIYDAAHCFGTKYKGRSIFEFGDIATTSFHSTKLFHTIEGGAVVTNSAELTKKMAYLRNFGHNGPEKFELAGVNGKNSEFHAAMGLCNLEYIDDILKNRKDQYLYYSEKLEKRGIQLLEIQKNSDFNYAYFPVIFESEEILDKTKFELERNKVFPRRYFYPILSELPYLDHPTHNLDVSESISKRVLCLPMYWGLTKEEQDLIIRIILRSLNYQ
jgi:dTDP-4-amino-4,6-dideoxygalactose transaminase